MPRPTLALAVFLVWLAIPAGAGATTYCVVHTGTCPIDQTPAGSVEAALTAASADLPGPNTVRIGPGTYDAAGPGYDYSAAGAPAVNIIGAGAGLTTLQSSSGAPFIMRLGVAGSSVSDVTLALRGPSVTGLILNADATLAQRVGVVGTGTPGSAIGVELNGAATFADGSVSMPDSSAADVEQVSGATGTVARSNLSGAVGLTTADSGHPALVGHDLVITASQHAVAAAATATVTVDTALVLMHGPSPGAMSSANASLSVRGATIMSLDGSGFGGSVMASDQNDASLTLRDSILRGFSSSFTRATSGPGTTADLTAQYDDLHLSGSGPGSTPGTVTFDHNIDTDPRFVDPASGDYHLLAGSPAIDAGAPCDVACTTARDLDAHAPVDGDGDGTTTADLGAYEYGHHPPSAQPVTGRRIAVNQPAPFDAADSSDPDDGDQLTYAWSFDDGATAGGVFVHHAFATAGVHRATLTVTDPTGLTGTAITDIEIVPAPPKPPSTRHRTKPRITNLMLSPSTFAVGARATVVSARSHRRPRPRPRRPSGPASGSSLHFTLNETSSVTIAIERILAGHRDHGHCRSSARRGRPCVVFESAGTLRRTAVRGGRVTIAFSGRVGQRPLAPGRYQLTVIAMATLGDISKPVRAPFTIVAR